MVKEDSASLTIAGGRLMDGSRLLDNALLTVREGRITYAGPRKAGVVMHGQVIAADGLYIGPGFLDLHVHGGAGEGFLRAGEDACRRICAAHSRNGTTGLLATVGTAPMESMQDAVSRLGKIIAAGACGSILGINLEGPYLNPARCGAQPAEHIRTPDRRECAALADLAGGALRIMTVAPEMPGALDCIGLLLERGVIPAVGHSDAGLGESEGAFAAGVRYVTHLFNAMGGLHHRRPGLAVAALMADGVAAELLVDGTHVHPLQVKLAYRVKGADGIILVTDCMEALDSGRGEFTTGGRRVSITGGVPTLDNGVLCGTVLSMSAAVRNFIRFTGAPLAEGIRMASANPARVLGLETRKGSLDPGKDADVVIFDDDLDVKATIIGGKVVYSTL
jgi:N-acetylglucosamine-6-phosphate deacetylase